MNLWNKHDDHRRVYQRSLQREQLACNHTTCAHGVSRRIIPKQKRQTAGSPQNFTAQNLSYETIQPTFGCFHSMKFITKICGLCSSAVFSHDKISGAWVCPEYGHTSLAAVNFHVLYEKQRYFGMQLAMDAHVPFGYTTLRSKSYCYRALDTPGSLPTS